MPDLGEPDHPPADDGPGEAQIRTFLIADVRGYTLFTQERGDEAAAKLAAKFADIAREGVEARGGTLLELRGDEALCVFTSTREAIRAAVDLQQHFVEETLERPELPLTVGIGLDAGEAVPVQGGYRGGALNLAARLCGQARAGEILASREVTHLARRVEGVRYEDHGSLSLKGLDEPVAVVRVVPDGEDPAERLRPFAPPAPPPAGKRSRRWPLVVGVAVALALVAISIPVLISGDGETADIGANSIARVNAQDGSLELATPLGQRPGASAVGFGSLWVAEPDRGVVARLNLEDGSVVDTIRVGTSPAGVAVGDGSVWVTNGDDGTVSRVDPETNEETDRLDVGSRPTGIAFGGGALWVADALGAELLRVDPTSGEKHPVKLDGQASGVAFTSEGVWVTVAPAAVARVDPDTLTVTLRQNVGSGPTAVLPAFESIWVANHLDDTVFRLDPTTGRVQGTIEVAEGPNALGAAAGSLWVASEFDDSITSIDPTTNTAGRIVSVGGAAASLAADGDGLWLAVGASVAEHRGGTLTISADEPPPSLDPASVGFNDEFGGQILSITNDGLLTFKKVGGAEGATLVPDLAAALPEVSEDGMSYRFTLRPGIRYSTGDLVRPEDFRHAIERLFSIDEYLGSLFGALDGAEDCSTEPSTCDLSGSILVSAEAVTFLLSRPDPDLLFKLALPAAFPVPTSTPAEDQGLAPIPATGPYMISEAGAGGILLVRNPAFEEWSGAAQPDGFADAISWRFDGDPGTAFDLLEAGEIDVMTDPPPEDLASLQAADPDRLALWPRAATFAVGLDVRKPPFDDERVRQAVNFAIDRGHVVDLAGGPASQHLTCQILPPNFQGYEPFCPYTVDPGTSKWTAPDLDRARTLISDAGVGGTKVTILATDIGSFLPGSVEIMRYVVEVLNEIGLRAHLKVVGTPDELQAGIETGEPEGYLFGWIPNYPSASEMVGIPFRCGSPGNYSGFCDEALDAAIDEAERLQGTDPAAANSAWIEIEHQLVDDAVWAPLTNPVDAYAFSTRTGNIQVHSAWGVLLSQLWVR